MKKGVSAHHTWRSASRGPSTLSDGGRGSQEADLVPAPTFFQLGGLCSQQVEITGIWSSFLLPGPQRRQNCGGLPSPRGGGNTRLLSALGSDHGALRELCYLTQAPSPALVCTLNSLNIVTFFPACLPSREKSNRSDFQVFRSGFQDSHS